MAERFEICRQDELPVTPEQVWDAVATSSGALGWLFPMEIEPRKGGTVSRGPATVTAWDPPRTFALRHDSDDGLSVSLEYHIEAQTNDSTILHTLIHRVHNGIVGDDWKTHIDAADKHTDFYHHTLGQYLRYFSGQRATYVEAHGPAASTHANAFTVLRRGLGLSDDIAQGDAVRLTVVGLDPLDAVVDYLSPYFIGLRTADGLYRFFGRNAWGWPISLSHHLFPDDVDREKTELTWRVWLDGVFA
ncbi:MAG: SRPBCC domain-containing protein [Pseudonocardiales bacterium]|nr:SRPBCC domain-containing protein [Pseudonocardiales bacterium]